MIPKEFYIPHSIELLFDFFGKYNINTNEKYTKEIKRKVLNTISVLIQQKIIFVGNWIDKENFKKWDLANTETIKKIDNLWNENAEFSEFYNIAWFGYEKWYVDALESLGMTSQTDWGYFVKNKIGNLEKWIEDNKPKDEKN